MCIIGAEPSITLSIKAQNPGQNRSLYLDSEPRDVKFSILAYLLWLKFEKKKLTFGKFSQQADKQYNQTFI